MLSCFQLLSHFCFGLFYFWVSLFFIKVWISVENLFNELVDVCLSCSESMNVHGMTYIGCKVLLDQISNYALLASGTHIPKNWVVYYLHRFCSILTRWSIELFFKFNIVGFYFFLYFMKHLVSEQFYRNRLGSTILQTLNYQFIHSKRLVCYLI